MIQAGKDVNEKDDYGRTPLLHASQFGHVEVITALLAAGADKNIKNEDGLTPHNLAKNQDTWNALNTDGTVALGLHQASKFGNLAVVNSLIQAGGDINTMDERDSTPLHEASRHGQVEVITALLAAGADKTIKNKQRQKPRDVAKNQECMIALG